MKLDVMGMEMISGILEGEARSGLVSPNLGVWRGGGCCLDESWVSLFWFPGSNQTVQIIKSRVFLKDWLIGVLVRVKYG